MTLSLETGGVQDDYARRALDQIAMQFPLATALLMDGAVTTAKLAAGAVTTAKQATLPQVRAFHNAVQSIANNAVTTLAFNSERWDLGTPNLDMHDTVTNNSRLTCRVAGLYDIRASVEFAANATGARGGFVRLNGTTLIDEDVRPAVADAGVATVLNLVTEYRLAVGDFVEVQVYQQSSVALNVTSSANYSPEFMARWVSP